MLMEYGQQHTATASAFINQLMDDPVDSFAPSRAPEEAQRDQAGMEIRESTAASHCIEVGCEKEVESDGRREYKRGNLSKQEQVLARLLHGKEKEWAAAAEKHGPLQLLDLPVDILKEIVKEITHTNDLTSLALTHSALHGLAIPIIYSRFDIVWPDAHAAADNRTGVDALTYGLATLVMAQDVFGEAACQRRRNEPYLKCVHCGHIGQCSHMTSSAPKATHTRTRRGNNFAQYTRKFSLGNGPADWVQEYLITKEGGKMLGTLVALAVGRMVNLETFVWDMPTGVLRDVWLALASLGDREDGQECRLERIWVRWHDNSEAPPPPSLATSPPPANPTLINPGVASSTNPAVSAAQTSLFQIPPYPRVEFPTFSTLPPLKSLSVLDIDELPYAEEMSVLIERSVYKLRELRIGVAQHAQFDVWLRPSEDKVHVAPSTASSLYYTSRPGGILGLLVSRFCDAFSAATSASGQVGEMSGQELADPFSPNIDAAASIGPLALSSENSAASIAAKSNSSIPTFEEPLGHNHIAISTSDSVVNEIASSLASHSLHGFIEQTHASVTPVQQAAQVVSTPPVDVTETQLDQGQEDESSTPKPVAKQCLVGPDVSKSLFQLSGPPDYGKPEPKPMPRLTLEVLELERVPLSTTVLSKAINWSRLTCLTILGCRNHEQLWKALRKRFTPLSASRTPCPLKTSAQGLGRPRSQSQYTTPNPPPCGLDYPLKIRRLHTDAVSATLISFIRDTLAADSLEWLFLQEARPYKSNVSIDSIYRGALRRHKGSLRKLLIDSDDKVEVDNTSDNRSWKRWIFNREVLSFITSGRMTSLRELSMAIDYRDWHFFLQRLPHITQLRSLHVPYIAEHVHARIDPRELALQVLDIVALRPELELCYLGIQTKCFEVLEYTPGRKSSESEDASATHGSTAADSGAESDGAEDEEGHHAADIAHHLGDHGETDSEVASSRGDDSDDEYGDDAFKGAKQFKLREILFYDDKVSIFKARHGKL